MEMTVTEIGAVVVAELRAAGYLESTIGQYAKTIKALSPKLRGLRVGISCLTRHASLPLASACSQESIGVPPVIQCHVLLRCAHAGAADSDARGQDQEPSYRQAGPRTPALCAASPPLTRSYGASEEESRA